MKGIALERNMKMCVHILQTIITIVLAHKYGIKVVCASTLFKKYKKYTHPQKNIAHNLEVVIFVFHNLNRVFKFLRSACKMQRDLWRNRNAGKMKVKRMADLGQSAKRREIPHRNVTLPKCIN